MTSSGSGSPSPNRRTELLDDHRHPRLGRLSLRHIRQCVSHRGCRRSKLVVTACHDRSSLRPPAPTSEANTGSSGPLHRRLSYSDFVGLRATSYRSPPRPHPHQPSVRSTHPTLHVGHGRDGWPQSARGSIGSPNQHLSSRRATYLFEG